MKITHLIFGILGISLVIGIHEIGHWSMCQLFGVTTPTVSIGIGPSIAEFHLGRTQLSIGILPIGGYVEMLGSRLPVTGFERESFASRPFIPKALIILGGILFNLLFGFLTIFILKRRERDQEKDQPELTSQEKIPEKRLVGPIGIVQLLMQSVNQGRRHYFYLLSILSINLAIFNLIPLPLLDGGQLVFSAYESLTGSSLSDMTYDTLSLITILIFVLLLVYTTGRDLGIFKWRKS